jgi:hypothetical protein
MQVILERPILPWSQFQIRYVTFPQGIPVVQRYGFTWKGQLHSDPTGLEAALKESGFAITPVNDPLLKWQNNPEIRLGEMFTHGEVLKVTTYWQPLLLWPLRLGWQTKSR